MEAGTFKFKYSMKKKQAAPGWNVKHPNRSLVNTKANLQIEQKYPYYNCKIYSFLFSLVT